MQGHYNFGNCSIFQNFNSTHLHSVNKLHLKIFIYASISLWKNSYRIIFVCLTKERLKDRQRILTKNALITASKIDNALFYKFSQVNVPAQVNKTFFSEFVMIKVNN